MASIFICCKDDKTEVKNAVEPSLQCAEAVDHAKNPDNKTNHGTTSIKKLKQAFDDKKDALFLEQFPSDFYQLVEYFGWYDENAQPNGLYEESYGYIDYFFDLLYMERHKEFEDKMLRIAENGRWQADGVNYFQDKVLEYIKDKERYSLIDRLSTDEAKSVLFFLFDGPYPVLDTELSSNLSASKKEILLELFETDFYGNNKGPDPILDEEGNLVTYTLSDYIGTEHFFIRDIDVNNDGISDKIVSSDSYQGDELLLFVNNQGKYEFALKTINFSEDGGNQIVDILPQEKGFVIATAFPDGGLNEAYHYVTFTNNRWVLTNTVYKVESSNQEDALNYVCAVKQVIDLANTDFLYQLNLIPNERERERLCTKQVN